MINMKTRHNNFKIEYFRTNAESKIINNSKINKLYLLLVY